ncbi:MAG: DNA polymerase III subunit alpha [Bacteroidia bacterium]|nr:DNA polymerase III subunit alpha [Bacteroidia bacterium]
MINFTHLHVHTQYSILDGASPLDKLIAKAKKDGMTALAITDHGNLFGAKDFHKLATTAELKPIIGCEVYVAKNSRFSRSDKEDRGDHMILLAKNMIGYKNLIRMISLAWIEGQYYNPRVDMELLQRYHEGIICSTACIGGVIPQLILKNDEAKIKATITLLKNIFGEDLYFELMRHKTGDPVVDQDVYARQEIINNKLLELSAEFDVKCIATNDAHFIDAEDAEAHDRLICINTGKEVDDPDRMSYTKQEYLKTQAEMNELFADIPEALSNTCELAEKVENYILKQPPVMPDFKIPDNFSDGDEYLRYIAYEGAKTRYPEITEQISRRIDDELEVIKTMGYPGYFLIVREVLNEARKMGVSVGPGRGSAAGSVVAYCLNITNIDPLKYNLLFERFLNPDRVSLPDIDIDFDEDGREKVLNWVVNQYGFNRVAQIVTFGTMAAKMAIRDVARVQKLPLSEADRLSKLVPEKPGTTLHSAYKEVKELNDARKSDNKLVAETLKYAEILEGSVRHTGLHACGIIICRDELIEHIPLFKTKESELLVSQYEGKIIEEVGMLKMDFLGLKTLSIISDAVENIRTSTGKLIDIETLPLDDPETYHLYSHGETTGLFQFESDGMKKYLKELKPNRFEDLIAMNALYRPGPMEYIPMFINRKHGKEKINYDFPVMAEYLEETYGVTVYQEQVMLLSQALANFTKGEADSLRKAMGKKDFDLMTKMREKFLSGCKANNLEESRVLKVWNDWEKFAEYAFNKSHSTCYSLVSYQTGWLKAHYPAQFMAAVLSRNLSDIKSITKYMDECKRMGLLVLGPDVNESFLKFNVNNKGQVRFGLAAIKGVGEAAVLNIIEERDKGGTFTDIFNFVERVNLRSINKRTMEALALAGAFDSFNNVKRHQYFVPSGNEFSFIETLIRYGTKVQEERNAPQQSLFGLTSSMVISKPDIPVAEEWSDFEKLNKERELIGIYLSAHPLDKFKLEVKSLNPYSLDDLSNLEPLTGKKVIIAGIVKNFKTGTTRNGNPYGSIMLEDYRGSYTLMLYGNDYVNHSKYFVKGYSLIVRGKVQYRQSYGKQDNSIKELEFRIENIEMLSEYRKKVRKIRLVLSLDDIDENFGSNLVTFTESNKGNVLIEFKIYEHQENQEPNIVLFSRKYKVSLNDETISFFEKYPDIKVYLN